MSFQNISSTRRFAVIGPRKGANYVVDGVDDDVQIRQCIADGHKSIFFQDHEYGFDRFIDLTGYKDITFLGQSKNCSFYVQETSLSNFGFTYLFQGSGENIKFENLHIAGKYSEYTNPSENLAGGISMGKGYTVTNCLFSDPNYFGLWINSLTQDATISYNRFTGPGRGNDHIGGGITDGSTFPSNIHIYENVWETSISGNAFNNTGGRHYWIHHNYNYSDRSFYLEAMYDMHVHNNHMEGGNIIASSDKNYHQGEIRNSNNIHIYANNLEGGYVQYAVENDDPSNPGGVGGALRSATVGGNVTIKNNVFNNSALWAILVSANGYDKNSWGKGVSISDNIITNANADNNNSVNIGVGVIDTAGINISHADIATINNNIIIDNRTTKLLQYGVCIGHDSATTVDTTPTNIFVNNNITSVLLQATHTQGTTIITQSDNLNV